MGLDSAIQVILQAEKKQFVFDGNRKEIDRYLQAVDKIQRTIDSSSDEQSKAESAIQVAMSRLADHFRNILKLNAKSTDYNSSVDQSSSTYSTTMTDSASSNYQVHEEDFVNCNTMSIHVLNDLRSISVRMNSAGYLHDCVQVYNSERKSVINATFQRLNIQKLSSRTARKLEWGVLDSMIKVWIKSAKICVNFLFPKEKRFVEQIFQGLGNATVVDSCFTEIVKDSATQLIDIVEALSSIRPSSERLFRILDLYETLSGLLPQINSLFQSNSSEFFSTKVADQILPKLAESVRGILSEFEKSLLTEESHVLSGLPIHRLPKYVMNYVSKLCDHKQTLLSLSLSKPSSDGNGVILEIVEFEGQSLLSLHVIWIIMRLMSNLEGKAKLCEDESANHFFTMNNVHYIVQKIKGHAELRDLVGYDYFKKLVHKFDQAKEYYLSLTHKKILRCFRDEGLNGIGVFSSKATKLTQRLKTFNVEFEKVHQNLAKLVVPDFQLLVDLRKSIVNKLVPAYTSFLGQCKSLPGAEKYVKYSTEGLEAEILDFFKGTPNPSIEK